jgi:hypothetical protein
MFRPRMTAPKPSIEWWAKVSSTPSEPPPLPNMALKVFVPTNQRWSSVPRFPRGSRPAPNPSSDKENPATLTRPTTAPLLLLTCYVAEPVSAIRQHEHGICRRVLGPQRRAALAKEIDVCNEFRELCIQIMLHSGVQYPRSFLPGSLPGEGRETLVGLESAICPS